MQSLTNGLFHKLSNTIQTCKGLAASWQTQRKVNELKLFYHSGEQLSMNCNKCTETYKQDSTVTKMIFMHSGLQGNKNRAK